MSDRYDLKVIWHNGHVEIIEDLSLRDAEQIEDVYTQKHTVKRATIQKSGGSD